MTSNPRNLPISDDSTVSQRRDRVRQQLVNLGLRPREADARASIAQYHLSDFSEARA